MEAVMKLVIILVGTIVVLSLLLAFPTMWLWNWLMPILFGLPLIDFWQALGITSLSSILFKSTSSSK